MSKIFSKRNKKVKNDYDIKISNEVRYRIWRVLIGHNSRDRLTGYIDSSIDHPSSDLIVKLRNYLLDEFGYLEINKSKLPPAAYNLFPHGAEEKKIINMKKCFTSCSSLMFFNILESLFMVEYFEDDVIDKFNNIFEDEEVGITLSYYQREEYDGHTDFNVPHKCIRTIAYPQVIINSNQMTYCISVAPCLKILTSNLKFKSANEEILKAHKHYRNQEWDDCVLKCGKAIESTLKTICSYKKWKYNQRDVISKLIDVCVDNNLFHKDNGFNTRYMNPMQFVGTIRNDFGAHGKGPNPIYATGIEARHLLGIASSNILFLIEKSGIK